MNYDIASPELAEHGARRIAWGLLAAAE